MATQTSLVAQQVRLQQQAEQIRDCQSRPKGMDVETWCAQNNLTKHCLWDSLHTYKYLTYLLSQRPNDKMSEEQLEQLAPWIETAQGGFVRAIIYWNGMEQHFRKHYGKIR